MELKLDIIKRSVEGETPTIVGKALNLIRSKVGPPDHHIPRKRIRPTNNPPWFSQEIKRLINAKQHSYRRLKRY
ncbi:hypothetical protein FHG87_022422 [Trinorchestia longiramus]|nr:hypothetical protein FHG87_022422 [Trinorchestia longiramus]